MAPLVVIGLPSNIQLHLDILRLDPDLLLGQNIELIGDLGRVLDIIAGII